MESIANPKASTPTVRQLATLKLVSRLLAHEMHAQASAKQVTLSKDELVEIQTCIDLFIEDATRRQGTAGSSVTTPVSVSTLDPQLVGSRTN
jgi:hypothetical protein